MKSFNLKTTIATALSAMILTHSVFAADTAPQAAPAVAPAPGIKQGDPVVAIVDGKDVKRSDVLKLISQQPDQVRAMDINTLFPKARDQLIANDIIMAKADKANLTSDPEVQADLDQARRQIIAGVYVDREVKKEMTDAKLHEIYNKAVAANKNVEEVKARQILSDTEDKAKDVVKKLDGGADFETLAKASGGASAQNGGELGYFTKTEMPVPAIADAAFALKKGAYTKTPVKTPLGWAVLQAEDRRMRPVPKFDDVKPQVEAAARQQLIGEILAKWQKSATVKKFDINGDPDKSSDK